MSFSDVRKTVEEAAEALRSKQAECGLGGSSSVVDALTSVQDSVSAKDNFHQVQDGIEGIIVLQHTMETAIKDPSQLTPGGACFAGCAKGYGDQVALKLNVVKDDALGLGQEFAGLKDVMESALDGIASSWGGLVPELHKQVRELMDLPEELLKIARKCEGGFDDIAKIDMGPIQRSLDISPLDGIATTIDSSKTSLTPAVTEVKDAVNKLRGFVMSAPKRVEESFQLMSCIPAAALAPPVYTTVMEELRQLKKIDLSPVVEVLEKIISAIQGFDVSKLLDPVKDFVDFAASHLDQVTAALEAAKSAAAAEQQLEQLGEKAGEVGGWLEEGASKFEKLW
jgi:hypothetical protein